MKGVLFHETSDALALGTAMESLRLGGPGQYSGVFRGMIDDLGVFGVALNQEEICSLAYRLTPLGKVAYTEPPPIARPPMLTLLSPVDGASLHPVDGGIRFRVAACSPKAIARTAIRLFVNEQDVSGRMLLSGSERNWTIVYLDRLQPNQFYTVRAFVTDDSGLQTSQTWRFDTVDGRLSLASAQTRGNANGLSITFSGPVNPASATNAANYTIDQGVSVHSASLVSPHQVQLHTSLIAEGQAYTVTINGVAGTDAAPGLIPPNTRRRFVQSQGVLTRREFHDISGTQISDLTNHVKFPHAPDLAGYVFDFEAPANVRENYGVQLAGYLVPPVSGDYVFFICSDDEGALFLSSDESPANKRLIAREPAWNPPRFWHNAINQDSRSFSISTPFVEGALFVEAEDFDFDGGQFVTETPIGMNGPYSGGAYAGRGTLADRAIDWRTRKAVESPAYRPGVEMHLIDVTGLTGALSRGAFSVTSSHAMHWDGWHDGTDFLNFTRNFPLPARDYYVLARVSSGAWQIDSTLSEVTAGIGTADQTTAHLGRFVTPSSTGGWDQYVFVPMRDALGSYQRVRLGARHTLRYTKSEGGSQDFDYLVFTPAGPAGEELPKNMSRPITLVAGQKYYIEALMKEGGGGDNLAVAWQMPGGPAPANGLDVIPGAYLSSLEPSRPVTIAAAPENLSVLEHQNALFSVAAVGSPPLAYQWRTNGVPVPGGTNATLALADVPASSDGMTVSVEVANAFSSAGSVSAQLRVTPDLAAPVVQSVQAGPNWLHATFSKPLQCETATNAANYQVNGGVQVLSATLAPDGKTVLLTTTPQASRGEYSLSVRNVRDTSSSGNQVTDAPLTYTALPHSISLDPDGVTNRPK